MRRSRVPAQAGFSMVGALLAITIVGVVAAGAADILGLNSKLLAATKQKRDRDKIVGNILNVVVESLPTLQREFDVTEKARQAALDTKNLPFAWDNNSLLPVKECPRCPGRMGFVLQPLPGRLGMNRLTVRLYHSAILKEPRDYVFIISDE